MAPIISILIPTLPERDAVLATLLANIKSQIQYLNAQQSVEILIDNRDRQKATTGAKRNNLLQAATGQYVVGVDDDDLVPDYYIEELLKAAQSDADCFAINGIMTTNGSDETKWYIAKDLPYSASKDAQGKTIYLRPPNHITPVRASIAKQIPFEDVSQQEDYRWCMALKASGLIKTEYTISKPLYHYAYNSKK